MIGVHSGYRGIKSAWQNSRDAFAKPGEEMLFSSPATVYTNMPRKHLKAFLEYAEATIDVMFWVDEAAARST
jgi:hypothetical protein